MEGDQLITNTSPKSDLEEQIRALQQELARMRESVKSDDVVKSQGDAPPTIAAAGSTFKLPKFIHKNPNFWFEIIETNFSQNHPKIEKEETKYRYFISGLEDEKLLDLAAKYHSSKGEKTFSKIKAFMIKELMGNHDERIRQLLEDKEIGSMKPTEFLAEMRRTAGDTAIGEGILRNLFIKKLPERARAILAVLKTDNVDELATAADKIMAELDYRVSAIQTQAPPTPPSVTPSQVLPVSPSPITSPTLTPIEQSIQFLINEIKELKASRDSRPHRRDDDRSRGRNFDRRRGRSKSRDPNQPRLVEGTSHCWYHHKFGKNATKCDDLKNCTFLSANPN